MSNFYDEQIVFFSGVARRHKHNQRIRRQCNEIISGLLKDKLEEAELDRRIAEWKIKPSLNIGETG